MSATIKILHRIALTAAAGALSFTAAAQDVSSDVIEALETGVIATPMQRANIYLESEDWDKLLAFAQKWTAEFPGESEAWRYLGIAHKGRDESQPAADAFLRAWELSEQKDVRIIESVGDSYNEIKEWELAENAYRKAVALHPQNAALRTKLADMLWILRPPGWESEMIEGLEIALGSGEYVNDLNRWQQYAAVLDIAGADFATRYTAHRHVVRLDVKNVAAWETLYDIETARQKTKDADKIARMLARINPKNPVANLHYGNSALEEGRTEKAVEYFQVALEDDKLLTGARRSQIYTILGDTLSSPARALSFYRDAVESDPSNFAAWEQAVVMLRELNRRAESQTVFEQLLAAKRRFNDTGEVAPDAAQLLLELK